MIFCLNLCEISAQSSSSSETIQELFQNIEKDRNVKIERVFIGSSFCSQYFINFSSWVKAVDFCRKKNIKITLVVPVFSESDLFIGKKKIDKILSESNEIIDEVTVNDIGMLSLFQAKKKLKINIGRLFFKDPRDCRVPAYTKLELSPQLLSCIGNQYLEKYNFNGIELDPTNEILNLSAAQPYNYSVAIHFPFCYTTTGNVCKFASIHKSIEKKFRPNTKCGMECLKIVDYYSGHVVQTDCDPTLIRIGRTLYFKNDNVTFVGKQPDRIIYFPFEEWRKML